MTKRRAIQILIRHAAANVRGTAQGIRPEITDADRAEVRGAVECVFELANGHKMDNDDRFNLGL